MVDHHKNDKDLTLLTKKHAALTLTLTRFINYTLSKTNTRVYL